MFTQYKHSSHIATNTNSYPLKQTTLENTHFKLFNKARSSNQMLFKQQIMREKEKRRDNSSNSSNDDLSLFAKRNREEEGKGEDNGYNGYKEYEKLMGKFNRCRSKNQRPSDNQNSKSFLNTTLKLNSKPHDSNQTLNASFKSNESRLKFFKKEQTKSPVGKLSKCLSMNVLETFNLKNRKTPPNREISEDYNKQTQKPSMEIKNKREEPEVLKLLSEIKGRNRIIRELESRQEELARQLSSQNKVQVQYYKLLNQNILLQEQIRTKDRTLEEYQGRLEFLNDKILVMEEQKENDQNYRRNDLTATRQHQQSIDEWKKSSQTLSDSLKKLNQQNTNLSRKLSEIQSRYNTTTNKLIESQKLVNILKSNVEFEKNAHESFTRTHALKIQEAMQKIKTLQKSNQYSQKLQKQAKVKVSEMGRQLQEIKRANKILVQQLQKSKKDITLLNENEISKNEQICSYRQLVDQLQNKLQDLQNKQSISRFTVAQQQLRQQLIISKLLHQQKQQKYQETIRDYQNKISLLEDEIDQIKSITSQSYNILDGQNSNQELNDQKRENLRLQTDIVEMKSKIQVFSIIEKELRERLEESEQVGEENRIDNKMKMIEKDSMIEILKERNELLEKELEIITSIKSSQSISENDNRVQVLLKEQISKIHHFQQIITSLHTDKKKVQYELMNKKEFIEELKKQIDKDQDTIKEFKSILTEMNKRLISHSELLQITNKQAINQQFKLGNFTMQATQQIQELKEENATLQRELKSIYYKLQVLQQKISEEDQGSNYDIMNSRGNENESAVLSPREMLRKSRLHRSFQEERNLQM